MTINELHSKIVAAKQFLNSEIVKIRTNVDQVSEMGFREIGDRLDMIHEVERIGIRNLNDSQTRKISRVVVDLEKYRASAN
ncbi:MAG TPA: hypothetical protein ENJ82_00590 [Bacteroidetes bacterium]|nr:hypothetical protein [Bacteroidota bacterium]